MTNAYRSAAPAQVLSTEPALLRFANRAVFLVLGLSAFAGLILERPSFVQWACAASVAYAVLLVTVGSLVRWRRSSPGKPPPIGEYWYASAFAAGVLATLSAPVWFFGITGWLSPIIAVAGSLALMAGLTSFCLGRFIFVFVFGRASAKECV